MTTTEPTTDERIVVLPEVTIPADVRVALERAEEILSKLMPELHELHAAAMKVRDANNQALIALYPYVGASADEVYDLAGKATGWEALSLKLVEIGGMFEADVIWQGEMSTAEIARGEANIPYGTFARVDDPEGRPVRVMVERVPRGGHDNYTVVNADDLQRRYDCGHEELKAGVEAELKAQQGAGE